MGYFNLRSALMAATVLFAASTAHATPIVITDQLDVAATYQGADYAGYSSANFANRVANGRHWGDELSDPDHRFDTTQITVDRNNTAGTLTLTLHTMFNGSDSGARYADLFFDTTTPSTPDNFGYAIALGDQTEAAGVYTVGHASTSNDIWSGQSTYVYGGYAQFKPSSPNYDPNMALPEDTRLDSGTQLSDYNVSVSQAGASGGFYDVTVVISSLTGLDLFNDFDLFWGTGDCGNDAIWGEANTLAAGVPAPGALSLLGAGLLALVLVGAKGRRPLRAVFN